MKKDDLKNSKPPLIVPGPRLDLPEEQNSKVATAQTDTHKEPIRKVATAQNDETTKQSNKKEKSTSKKTNKLTLEDKLNQSMDMADTIKISAFITYQQSLAIDEFKLLIRRTFPKSTITTSAIVQICLDEYLPKLRKQLEDKTEE